MHVVNQVYYHLCHQDPSSYCVPFQKDPDGVPYAPCGAVANSMFNGTFHSGGIGGDGGVVPPGIITSFLSLTSRLTSSLC